jgi:hypothetical protein
MRLIIFKLVIPWLATVALYFETISGLQKRITYATTRIGYYYAEQQFEIVLEKGATFYV